MTNLEDKTTEELMETINSMTHVMNQVGCYSIQHGIYKELQAYWTEFHRRDYGQ